MSPRAACRLETLGFVDVHDYVAGKSDWLAAGLPVEGVLVALPRIGEVARSDVATSGLSERVGDAARRARQGGWDTSIVVSDGRVVLGRLYRTQLDGDPDALVEDVMQSGPSCFRPNIPAPDMLGFMHEHDLRTAPVTTSDGRLTGLLLRDDVERVVHEWHSAITHDQVGAPDT